MVVETERDNYTREDNNLRGFSILWQKDTGQGKVNWRSSHGEPWKEEQKDVKEDSQ